LFLSFNISAQTILYQETFDEANRGMIGKRRGPATLVNPSNGQWTITGNPNSFSDEDDYFKTINGELVAQDVNEEACFVTSSIDISGSTNVTFTIDVFEDGDQEDSDYLDVEYRIDGGSWSMIPNWNGDGNGSHTLVDDWSSNVVTQSGLSGSTLEIRVCVLNNSGSEEHILDNVIVTGNCVKADDLDDVSACDSYELQPLTNGNYFTGPGGTGDALSAGDDITTTQTIYVYVAATNNCPADETDFVVTIEDSVKADDLDDVSACDSYELQPLTNGNYFTGPGGTGDALSAGDEITSTQTIYVCVAATQNCPSDETDFVVTINYSVEAGEDGSLVICEGGSVTAEDLFAQLTGADGGGTWSPEPLGAGTYTYTVYGAGACPNDTATVEVTEQVVTIVAADPVCGEVEGFGFYSVDVTTNEGIVTSSHGAVTQNNEVNWTISDIPNGQNITVTTTTSLGCKATVDVIAPDCYCIELYYEYTDVTCYGLDDGTITVTQVSEGATVTINGQPYDANMLYAPGSYTIKAFYEGVDNDDCIFEDKIDILEPELVDIDAVGTDVTCYGANDGTITVSNLSAGAVYTIKKNGIGPDLSDQSYFGPGMYIVKAFLPDNGPNSGG
jgi:hypothetical protein